MAITDLPGRLTAIISTPRLATLEAALQASLALAHAPVSSRLQRVDKVGEPSAARQAVDSHAQVVPAMRNEPAKADLRSAEPVLTHLSKTAGLLASLLPRAASQGPSHATLVAGQPVLDAPPHYPASLAMGLQDRLQDSGLFYESHLLGWYQGQYPLARLAQEPQSRLTSQPANDAVADNAPGNPAGTTPVPNEAARLIAQQLLLLDKPSLQWSVNVWPGQSATLLIEEEAPRSADMQRALSTHIQLDFPRLGRMDISLKMDAHGLSVHLEADDHAVAPLLQQRKQCAERLALTGCRLREFSIGASDADA
jgi:hypothetical protein